KLPLLARGHQRPAGCEPSFHLGAVDAAHAESSPGDERDDQHPRAGRCYGADLANVRVAVVVVHVVQAAVVDNQLQGSIDSGLTQLPDVGVEEVDVSAFDARL